MDLCDITETASARVTTSLAAGSLLLSRNTVPSRGYGTSLNTDPFQ